MPVVAVIGAQWGDEGKGKVVDLLAEKADVVVRFSGGDNAGHTVVNSQGEFKLHIVPSGIFNRDAECIIGNGVVINPPVLIDEIAHLNQRGVKTGRLHISDRAHLTMPYHVLLDKLEEAWRGGKAIGTTGKGIGPVYCDKVARQGIRASDILNEDTLANRLRPILEYKNAILTKVHGAAALSFDEILHQYLEYGKNLAPYIGDTTRIVDEARLHGRKILLEGAQGALLDPDFGTYPFTTSSSPLAGNASLGSGMGLKYIDRVLGVYKAYCSRVGGGPMPTELKDETGDQIREHGHEYGTTTGRARRCGWFDAVAAGLSTRVNGFTEIAITRLDVLDFLPSLKICTAYLLNGKKIDYFPANINDLEKCVPVYEELPGWQTPIKEIRSYVELPLKARRYIRRIEELAGARASLISVGEKRTQTIFKKTIF